MIIVRGCRQVISPLLEDLFPMRRLYQASDRIEAQHLVDFLADHDVPAIVLGDYLSGAAGDLPVNIFPGVWLLRDTHWAYACHLLAEFRAPAATAPSWPCAQCGEVVEGEFDVCWNCGCCRDVR
jgi:hypothetical protein